MVSGQDRRVKHRPLALVEQGLALPHMVRAGLRNDLSGFAAESPDARMSEPEPLTVDLLTDKLMRIKALGMGAALVKLPDGQAVADVELVAAGEKPAHFVVKGK